jgi:moderate conductance mechanosensitive channel
MWGWFIDNASWILIASSVVALLLLLFNRVIRDKLSPSGDKKWQVRLHRLVDVTYWTVELLAVAFLITAFIAFNSESPGTDASNMETWIQDHGAKTLIILAVGIVLWLLTQQLIPPLVERVMTRPQRGESREGMKRRMETLKRVFLGLTRFLVVFVIFIIILSEMKVEIGPLLASLGIIGVAVGFGAQYLVKDLIAGIFVLMENQYRVGDIASVGGVTGVVEEVNLRKTVLRDLDGIVHHVPNGEIRVASNYSRHFARVNLNISVSYGTDLDYAIEIINEVCRRVAEDEKWAKVFRTVPEVLRVDSLGDSGIDIKILGEVQPLQQWAVMGELRKRIKTEFDKVGIEIPWPHTKVYFGNSPENNQPGQG